MESFALYVGTRCNSLFSVMFIGGLAVTGLTGCASPVAPIENPSSMQAAQYRAAFDASVSTLLENGYRIDRRDYRFGKIKSKPERSPTIWEVWKPANTTSEEMWGSTLSAWRRVVTVTIVPGKTSGKTTGKVPEVSGQYQIGIEVALQRYQNARRRLAGSTRSRRIVRPLSEVPTEMKRKGIGEESWETFGRDEDLEQRMLTEIVKRMSQPQVDSSSVQTPD